MLRIRVINSKQNQQFEHMLGPMEFGRGPQRRVKRCVIEDDYVSRDQVRLEELPSGRLRVENLSQRTRIECPNGVVVPCGEKAELDLPTSLTVGYTRIDVEPLGDDPVAAASLMTIAEPVRNLERKRLGRPLSALGDAPAPETIAGWLEVVIALQGTVIDSPEFLEQAARALVELVGLDLGLVVLRQDDNWNVAARYTIDPTLDGHFSRTLLNHVFTERRTFYQGLDTLAIQAESLRAIDAAVASPIFGLQEDVIGALCGLRSSRHLDKTRIRPLEAQVVQLLAAAVGAHLARVTATRTRLQLEQFASAELVRQLERDPSLLEARTQEVTVLVSDLRGFTRISERLGAQLTCRLVRDLMERLSDRVRERGGFIVDYAGDGMLAMWNAPLPQEDHVVRACQAALALRAELPGLNAEWQEVIGEPLNLGIGLNTGPAQVGNTGTRHLFRYGAIGHTVNVASRVQDATKRLGVPLLLTGSTRDKLPENFQTNRMGRAQLPGVADEIVLYELVGEDAATSRAPNSPA
jgi:adenylate cyclase